MRVPNLAAMPPKARLAAAVGATVAAILLTVVPEHEGTVLRVYRDPVGIPTACVGHTGPDVMPGKTYTPAECEAILVSDLMKHDADISRCIAVDRLTPGQRAAFVSFAFNVGAAKFCGSTLARKAKAGDMAGACAELSKWTYAGGKQLPGLVKRRAHERAICEGRA